MTYRGTNSVHFAAQFSLVIAMAIAGCGGDDHQAAGVEQDAGAGTGGDHGGGGKGGKDAGGGGSGGKDNGSTGSPDASVDSGDMTAAAAAAAWAAAAAKAPAAAVARAPAAAAGAAAAAVRAAAAASGGSGGTGGDPCADVQNPCDTAGQALQQRHARDVREGRERLLGRDDHGLQRWAAARFLRCDRGPAPACAVGPCAALTNLCDTVGTACNADGITLVTCADERGRLPGADHDQLHGRRQGNNTVQGRRRRRRAVRSVQGRLGRREAESVRERRDGLRRRRPRHVHGRWGRLFDRAAPGLHDRRQQLLQ